MPSRRNLRERLVLIGSQLEEPIRDPVRLSWHEVSKVAHYWLSVDALAEPMQVRDRPAKPYGSGA
jgi:hypothetical protein